MDRTNKYRSIIQSFLEGEANKSFSNAPELERQLIVDKNQNQFLLMVVGWHGEIYKHYALFHFQLKDGKVWLHQNNTDIDMGECFEKKGLPKSDLVLGFLDELERELSEYAVA